MTGFRTMQSQKLAKNIVPQVLSLLPPKISAALRAWFNRKRYTLLIVGIYCSVGELFANCQ